MLEEFLSRFFHKYSILYPCHEERKALVVCRVWKLEKKKNVERKIQNFEIFSKEIFCEERERELERIVMEKKILELNKSRAVTGFGGPRFHDYSWNTLKRIWVLYIITHDTSRIIQLHRIDSYIIWCLTLVGWTENIILYVPHTLGSTPKRRYFT